MNDQVRQGYNQVAENYAAGRDQFKNEHYLEIFNKLLKPGSLILDLGCGNGRPVDTLLVERGHRIIGLDVSEKQIELARQNLPEEQFELKDISKLQIREYGVDAVVSFYAIFHTPRQDQAEIFKKINSFLPIGGHILITLGRDDWEGSEENFFGAKMYWSQNTPETNTKIIQEAGFEIILDEIDYSGGEGHRMIIGKKITEI